MADTNRLALPLLDPAQAQKHVTVNEALQRIDSLVQMVIDVAGGTTPPVSPAEGSVFVVQAGATGAWAGQDGDLAVFLGNGWEFITPRAGWRAVDVPTGASVTFDGVAWVPGAGVISLNGAGFVHRTVEVDHTVGAGASSIVAGAIPSDAIVYGVTGRVLTAIGGAVSLEIGVTGSTNRYGSGFGTGVGAWTRGLTASPLSYYSDTDLILTAGGGDFDGTGTVRIAVHFAELTLPRS